MLLRQREKNPTICGVEHLGFSHHRNIAVQQLRLIILCTPLWWAHLWASRSVATEKGHLGSNTFQTLYPLKSQIQQIEWLKTLQFCVTVAWWQQGLDCLWSKDQKCSGSSKTANRTGRQGITECRVRTKSAQILPAALGAGRPALQQSAQLQN